MIIIIFRTEMNIEHDEPPERNKPSINEPSEKDTSRDSLIQTTDNNNAMTMIEEIDLIKITVSDEPESLMRIC